MKYHEAKAEFQHVLDNQKTVEITKLKQLMQAMNMSLDPKENKEIIFLKGELQKMYKRLNKIEGNMA